MTCFVCVFPLGSGSAHQHISLFTLTGEALNTIRYHDGFMGQRIGESGAQGGGGRLPAGGGGVDRYVGAAGRGGT